MVVTQCRFERNASPGFGGAIYLDLSEIDQNFYVTIDSCFFHQNAAPQGGAIYSTVDITVINSTFAGNFASFGGEFYLISPSNGVTKFIGCTFEGEWVSASIGLYCLLGHVAIEDSHFQNLTAVSLNCSLRRLRL